MDNITDRHADADLIEQMGGTTAVAALCRIQPPSVSEWKRSGIPQARRDFLALLRPDIFGPVPELADAA